MKTYLLSDNTDSLVGLQMAGINGKIVHTKEEVLASINDIIDKKDVGILLLTEKISALIPEELHELKLAIRLPLIVEIPDRHGSIKSEDSILRYVTESIGLKI